MAVSKGGRDTRPQVMGIINATPDSFHESSRNGNLETAKKMAQDGADWIDIGGESTRPGATPVPINEEIERVIPLVEKISQFAKVSVDTRNPEVAKLALDSGALMINDVSGLRNPDMFELVIESGCKVCLMHMKGDPGDMQNNPKYSDVVEEVCEEITTKANQLLERGHPIENVYLDPGIGFGKNLDHNLELLKASEKLRPFSILWGVSRKSMIGEICNQQNTKNRLAGSLGVAAKAFYEGIDMIRVHDVREHVDMFSVLRRLED